MNLTLSFGIYIDKLSESLRCKARQGLIMRTKGYFKAIDNRVFEIIDMH